MKAINLERVPENSRNTGECSYEYSDMTASISTNTRPSEKTSLVEP
jgi:hypothetical protein